MSRMIESCGITSRFSLSDPVRRANPGIIPNMPTTSNEAATNDAWRDTGFEVELSTTSKTLEQ